jgi:hypothetical protein
MHEMPDAPGTDLRYRTGLGFDRSFRPAVAVNPGAAPPVDRLAGLHAMRH